MIVALIIGIILLIIIIILLISGILISKKLNKFFCKSNDLRGFITYDLIKDKYERNEYDFKSGKNNLKAYLYKGSKEKDLIIYVHGMCSGHQGYLSDITALIDRGYNVFTYDFTATGQSDGIYYLGLNQQLYDLDSCMKYLKSNDYYGYQNIYLYG
nr:lysophospholipase [Acholeplasmatales bacterium]